jgi:hypothetical protein
MTDLVGALECLARGVVFANLSRASNALSIGPCGQGTRRRDRLTGEVRRRYGVAQRDVVQAVDDIGARVETRRQSS